MCVYLCILNCVACVSVELIKTQSSVVGHLVFVGKWAVRHQGKRQRERRGRGRQEGGMVSYRETLPSTSVPKGLLI